MAVPKVTADHDAKLMKDVRLQPCLCHSSVRTRPRAVIANMEECGKMLPPSSLPVRLLLHGMLLVGNRP